MARRRPSLDRDWVAADTAPGLLAVRFPDHRTPESADVRRKLRLVLCGAARTVWDRLPHDDLRAAVEVAERFADERATRRDLDQARQAVHRRLHAARAEHSTVTRLTDHPPTIARAEYALTAGVLVQSCCERSVTVARVAARVLNDVPRLAAPLAAWEGSVAAGWHGVVAGPDPAAAVVRDQFGGPTPIPVPDAWKSAAAVAIAGAVALDADFSRLPVLADALEDAGCDDDRLLLHCRGPGPHWRGCWVVDGLLGR